VLIDENLKS